jgi:hypothetical protein
VKVVSSIYPQDENINNFFLNYNSENVEGSMVAIRALRNATPSSASNFFPVIFNELFQIICSYPEGPGREAFIDLLHLVHK